VFNVQGSEFIFLLVIALIVLGPEKLPDAVRKAGRAYAEFKKMANGFQGEIRSALDEPMREFRETGDAMRAAANFDLGGVLGGFNPDAAAAPAAPATPATHSTPELMSNEDRMNFGLVLDPPATADPAPIVREPGLNFGSANPRPPEPSPGIEPAASPGAESAAAAEPAEPAAEHGDLPG
jgi:sec-independent protein translocase protein TatB